MEHKIVTIINDGLAKFTVVNEYGHILYTRIVIGKQNVKLVKLKWKNY